MMRIFYTPDHNLHTPAQELHRGTFVTPHEGPHRMDKLLAGLEKAGFETQETAQIHDLIRFTRVHTPDYLDFLQTAYSRWKAAGYAGDVLPMSYPVNPRRGKAPEEIDGAAGYYCFSSDTPVTETSWQGAKAVADCAITAADSIAIDGLQSALTLIRPPGHHSGADYLGGYCLLNNAALATQALLDNGARRVAILDVDFHHGNGTQDIFFDRSDVLFCSIHGEPDKHFPYFWGHADETGRGAGEGFTHNYPLPAGTHYSVWVEALEQALAKTREFKPDAVVVSLGVDTFEQDPISTFKLTTESYPNYGARIASLGLPTLFIMEGGYGVPEIGDNVAGVLQGFLDG